MSNLDNSFEQLLGRQPTDAERQHLYRVRDALGIKNNDALWLLLIALQYHQSQYEKFPKAIAQAAQAILVDFRATADATAQASTQAAKADMASAVAEISQKVANGAAHTEKLKWVAGCAVVITLTFSGGFWFAFDRGEVSGYAAGYKKAEDEKAAAAWANTPIVRAITLERLALGASSMMVFCVTICAAPVRVTRTTRPPSPGRISSPTSSLWPTAAGSGSPPDTRI